MMYRLLIMMLFLVKTGDACSLKQYEYCRSSPNHNCQVSKASQLHQDDSGQDSPSRKKQRCKGIQLTSPIIRAFGIQFFDSGVVFNFPLSHPFLLLSKQTSVTLRGPPVPQV